MRLFPQCFESVMFLQHNAFTPLLALWAFCLPQHWTKRPYSCLTRIDYEATMDFNAPFSPLPTCR